MLLELKVLNSDAILNNFHDIGTARIVRNADSKIILRLIQPDKDFIRYIPASGATFEISLLKSDGTSLVKVPTQPFADDRSVLQLDLTEVETATLISQNLNAKITEGSDISFAILQSGLQIINLNTEC